MISRVVGFDGRETRVVYDEKLIGSCMKFSQIAVVVLKQTSAFRN